MPGSHSLAQSFGPGIVAPCVWCGTASPLDHAVRGSTSAPRMCQQYTAWDKGLLPPNKIQGDTGLVLVKKHQNHATATGTGREVAESSSAWCVGGCEMMSQEKTGIRVSPRSTIPCFSFSQAEDSEMLSSITKTFPEHCRKTPAQTFRCVDLQTASRSSGCSYIWCSMSPTSFTDRALLR